MIYDFQFGEGVRGFSVSNHIKNDNEVMGRPQAVYVRTIDGSAHVTMDPNSPNGPSSAPQGIRHPQLTLQRQTGMHGQTDNLRGHRVAHRQFGVGLRDRRLLV